MIDELKTAIETPEYGDVGNGQNKNQLQFKIEEDKILNGVDRFGEKKEKFFIETWPEKISKFLPIKFHLIFWVLLPEFIFLVQYILIKTLSTEAHGLYTFAVYLAITGYLTLLIPYTAKKLSSLLEVMLIFIDEENIEIKKWYNYKLQKLYNLKGNVLTFLFFGSGMTITLLYVTHFFQYPKPWFGNIVSDYVALVAFIFFTYVCSHQARFLVGLVVMMRQMAGKKLKIAIYQYSGTSIRAVGKVMFIIAINGAVSIALFYFGIAVSPISTNWLFVLWIAIAGSLVLGIFIFPQYQIHKLMSQAKHENLRLLGVHLEQATKETIEDPSNEKIERFEKLYLAQEKLMDGMHEWPFDLRSFLTILSAVIIPIIVAVFQTWLN